MRDKAARSIQPQGGATALDPARDRYNDRWLAHLSDDEVRRLPVLVGEDPAPWAGERHNPLFPLPARATGGRLLALTPCASATDYLRRTVRTDLFQESQGGRWRVAEARVAAQALIRSLGVPGSSGERLIIGLGRRVAAAFGYPKYDLERPSWQADSLGFRFAAIPHPSPRNRFYHSVTNKLVIQRFLGEVYNGADDR